VELRLRVAGWQEKPARLRLRLGGLLTGEWAIDRQGEELRREMELPPGDSVVEFDCAAPPLQAPGETRELVFRILGCSARDVTSARLHLAAKP
jgi:hypothetical protein